MHNLFWCQLRGQTLSTKCINYDIEIHVRKKPKGQARTNNPEKLTTLSTQDTRR